MAGRPRQPSTATIRRLYDRLERGPFWVSDWESAGVGSRGTAHLAIRFLRKKCLVKCKREGTRKMYFPNPDKSILDWWPYLTTERERRAPIDREWRRLIKRDLGKLTPRFKVVGEIVKERRADREFVEIELSYGEICDLIDQAVPNHTIADFKNTIDQVTSLEKCPECLKKRGKIVDTIVDPSMGDVVCVECGLVISRDVRERVVNSLPISVREYLPYSK